MARKAKPLTSDEYESYTKGSDKPKPRGSRGATAKERKAIEAAKKRSGSTVTAGEKKEAKAEKADKKTMKGRAGAKAAPKPAAASAAPSARAQRLEKVGGKAGKAYSAVKKGAKALVRGAVGLAKRHPVGTGIALTAAAAPTLMSMGKGKEGSVGRGRTKSNENVATGRAAEKPAPTPASKAKSSNSSSPKGGTGYSGKSVRTKGGDYPVYKKGSEEGNSFKSAFAAAKKAGKSEFTWQGRKYNTKTK